MMKLALRSLRLAAAAAVLGLPLAAQPVPAGLEIVIDPVRSPYADTAVSAAADGGFLALWNDPAGQISARAFSPDGAPRGSMASLLRPPYGDGHEDYGLSPDAVTLSGGGYVATWLNASWHFFNDTYYMKLSLAFRLLDASGQPAGTEIVVADDVLDTAVAATPSGGFVLAWSDGGTLVARRFDAHGGAEGGEILVSDRAGSVALAALPDGGFVATWIERSFGLPDSFLYRSFAADGTPRTPAIPLQNVPPLEYSFWISADASGRFVIAWIEKTSFKNRILARLFGPGGGPLGPAFEVTSQRAAEELPDADVAMRPDGSFLVVWERSSPNEILARAYGADGLPQGEAFPVPSVLGAHFRPDVATTFRGWLVSWIGEHPYVRAFTAEDCGGSSALCLNNGRFRVEATWRVPGSGTRGIGIPVPRTSDTGAFWFFQPSNYELLVKVLDGRGVNGHFWVFYGSLTNVEFDLTVTDTVTGQQRTYHNPAGTMASRADTTAF